MPVVFTSIARVKNWKALQQLYHETLLDRAREAGATHYCLYRNVKDASQALIVAEFPHHDAIRELSEETSHHFNALLEGEISDDRVWELVTDQVIG